MAMSMQEFVQLRDALAKLGRLAAVVEGLEARLAAIETRKKPGRPAKQ